jgi:hypothetical protein
VRGLNSVRRGRRVPRRRSRGAVRRRPKRPIRSHRGISRPLVPASRKPYLQRNRRFPPLADRRKGWPRRHAPVAQLDSASVFGTEGYRFESCRVYSFLPTHTATSQGFASVRRHLPTPVGIRGDARPITSGGFPSDPFQAQEGILVPGASVDRILALLPPRVGAYPLTEPASPGRSASAGVVPRVSPASGFLPTA